MNNDEPSQAENSGFLDLPPKYPELLEELKAQISSARARASLFVNRELILLYWRIGKQISKRMKSEGWGSKVIDRLAVDLRRSFPQMKGLSPRNLRYMRAFAETYEDEQFLQQAVAKLPWGHNVRILDYVRDSAEREFYVHKTIEHGWSRNVLVPCASFCWNWAWVLLSWAISIIWKLVVRTSTSIFSSITCGCAAMSSLS